MSLTTNNQFQLPTEIISCIFSHLDEPTWKAFTCICRYNAQIANWPESRIIDRLSKLFMRKLDSNSANYEFLATLIENKKVNLLTQCKVSAASLEFLCSKLPKECAVSNLHLVIETSQNITICRPELITSISLRSYRPNCSEKKVLSLLTQCHNLTQLYLYAIHWLSNVSLDAMPQEGHFLSYPSVKVLTVHQDPDSKTLMKLLKLFPNLNSLSLKAWSHDSMMHVKGRDQIQELEQALSKENSFDSFNTKTFIYYRLTNSTQS